jgi:hypothetical protein
MSSAPDRRSAKFLDLCKRGSVLLREWTAPQATTWTIGRDPPGFVTDDVDSAATQRAADTPSRDPSGARRAANRDGDGVLADLGAGNGRSRDSGGETRAIDFGELPHTLGRPGRTLDARPRAESLITSRRMSGKRAHRFEAGWRIRRRPVDPHKGATEPSAGRQTAKSLQSRSLRRALAPRDDCAG